MAKDVKQVNVVQDPDKPVATEIMAQAIVDIDKAFKSILNAGLNRNALVVLLYHATAGSVNKTQINHVLDAMDDLRKTYCTR